LPLEIPSEKVDMNDPELSRTQKKKADHELRELGEALVGLSPENLSRMDLPGHLLSAISFYHTISSHTARRRQWKTIAAMLRAADRAPIRSALENIQRGDRRRAHRHHQLEQWRDALKSGDLDVVEEIVRSWPGADRQRLYQLSRNAIKEFNAGKGVKASRALFRYLDGVVGEAL
jgi:ribosome-associated protein